MSRMACRSYSYRGTIAAQRSRRCRTSFEMNQEFRDDVRRYETVGTTNEEETRLKLLERLNDIDLYERLRAEPLPGQPRGDA
jgi:hypothetical protein